MLQLLLTSVFLDPIRASSNSRSNGQYASTKNRLWVRTTRRVQRISPMSLFTSAVADLSKAQIYPYRRNVAGSITVTLFAIHGALLTKLPLPQFLPSARLAHLRMINRVREVVQQSVQHGQHHENASKLLRQLAVRRKYMSWNAASAAQAEVIEFLEELVDLTKLLVGANEFRSGLLTRPTYHSYLEQPEHDVPKPINTMDGGALEESEARDEFREMTSAREGPNLRRRTTTRRSHEDGEDIPPSLRRIQSRKIEASIRRQRTNDGWNTNLK